jgi:hypothetical protein
MDSADKRRLRRKFDIRGVVSYATIRQYLWYGELSRKTCNEVDRAFYESIKVTLRCGGSGVVLKAEILNKAVDVCNDLIIHIADLESGNEKIRIDIRLAPATAGIENNFLHIGNL